MHILDPLQQSNALHEVFEKIANKKAIAFLGAGASVTNYKYLSSDIIKLYEAQISKSFETNDIIKFVDILQSTPELRRTDFDLFVIDQLRKLKPSAAHEIFVTIPWKQVITTNYDTLVEEASNVAQSNRSTHFSLKTIRKSSQLDYSENDNEINYVKLNGCKSDLSAFPLVFSTDDFEKQKGFYKKVISPFKGYSNEIIYIAFGYSFTDIFSEFLLQKLASQDIRQRRILYCIDPYISEDRLSFLESHQISIVKMTFQDFFESYQNWINDTNKNYIKNLQKFTNPDNSNIKLSTSSRLFLDSNILQLKDDYRISSKIKKADFYFGEEPNYQVVVDNFDVLKNLELQKLTSILNKSFDDYASTSIPNLLLINGDFGTGKTTFTLRSINEYLKINDSVLAFEITNPSKVKKGYLAQLINESTATKFLFYCDNIESDSIFKAFNLLRVDIASEQYSNRRIVFISSIRQNILEKLKNSHKLDIKNCTEFSYNSVYSKNELIELLENLKELRIVEYRDLSERDAFIYDIQNKYKGDSFITLYKMISNGAHSKLLIKAYEELSIDVKQAFKIVALIHRFNMSCPASVVKMSLKNYDWKEFTDKVVRGDGKGILYQEVQNSTNLDPDLFFKTKHAVIADALITHILTNNEKNSLYKSIFSGLTASDFNAKFAIDLLKNIRNYDEDITIGQISNYYELAKKELESSVHFMLSYVTNLEKNTGLISVLKNCLEDIYLLEGTLEKRNHRLIHRKGSLCFKIGRISHAEAKNNSEAKQYINESEEWFEIKKQLDPVSHYSYLDYFNLLLWKLKNSSMTDAEKINTHYKINNLFDESYRTLYGNTSVIDDLLEEYNQISGSRIMNGEYLDFLLERHYDVNTRATAAILLYYYYDYLNDQSKCDQYWEELLEYMDNKDVIYFMFKQYGRNLHFPNSRIQFFNLIRQNDFLKSAYPLRYYYFSAVSEFYNYRWKDGRELLNELGFERNYSLNPDFYLTWKDSNGIEEIFDGEVILERKIKKTMINSPFFKQFTLVSGNYNDLQPNSLVKVKLKFFLDSIKCEIQMQS